MSASAALSRHNPAVAPHLDSTAKSSGPKGVVDSDPQPFTNSNTSRLLDPLVQAADHAIERFASSKLS